MQSNAHTMQNVSRETSTTGGSSSRVGEETLIVSGSFTGSLSPVSPVLQACFPTDLSAVARRWVFDVQLYGTGRDESAAWADAVEAFASDPGEALEANEVEAVDDHGLLTPAQKRNMIEFPAQTAPHTHFLGRNGVAKCVAVQVFIASTFIEIEPITSKGSAGRCFIELPKDRGTILKLSQVLRQVAESLS